MQNDYQPNPDSANPDPSTHQPTLTGGQKVIQPSPGLAQELESQQQQPQPVVSGTYTSQPDQAQPTVPQSSYSQSPAKGTTQVGMSASQMGLNQSSKTSSFNAKKLVIRAVVGLLVSGGVFSVLVFTNIIALSQFKMVDYTNTNGTHYSLMFYAKHTTQTLESGNTQLVSKVSKDGHYPLTLLISSGPISELDKNGIKSCSGPFSKVFDVQNNNLNQQISVCNVPLTNGPPGVYVMGFAANNQANIVTISQDLSSEDISSQSAAQQSLAKFGLDPYQEDIKQIVASIKVQ